MEVTLTLTERGADHHEEVRALLREALDESGLNDVEVAETTIRADEEAIAIKCLGSPTIRINGMDVEYQEREPDESAVGAGSAHHRANRQDAERGQDRQPGQHVAPRVGRRSVGPDRTGSAAADRPAPLSPARPPGAALPQATWHRRWRPR